MTENNNIENIIKEVAIQNNVLIGEDDPILMVFTAQRLILEEFSKDLNKQLSELDNDLKKLIIENFDLIQTASQNQIQATANESRKLAETIINKTIEESEKRAVMIMENGLKNFNESIQDITATITSDINHKIRQNSYASKINLLASILILIAIIILATLAI